MEIASYYIQSFTVNELENIRESAMKINPLGFSEKSGLPIYGIFTVDSIEEMVSFIYDGIQNKELITKEQLLEAGNNLVNSINAQKPQVAEYVEKTQRIKELKRKQETELLEMETSIGRKNIPSISA